MQTFIQKIILKFRWTFFLLLIAMVAARGANVEIQELETRLETLTSETEVIDLMIEICEKYYRLDIDNDKAFSYAQGALRRSEKINYQKGKAFALRRLALLYGKKGKRLKAIESSTKALEIAKEINEELLIGILCNNLGYAYYQVGLYDKALEFYMEALPYPEKFNEDYLQVLLFENIGNLFHAINDEEKVIFYSRKAGEVARNSDFPHLQHIPDLHLAQEASASNNFLLAKKHFKFSLEKAYTPSLQAYVLRQIALHYNNHKRYLIAESKYKEAILIYEKQKDVGGLIDTKVELASMLNEMLRYKEALQIFSELLTKYEKENTQKDILLNIYSTMATIHQQLGNYNQSIESYQNIIALKDSIFDGQKIKIINGFDIKYNLKEKDKENQFLRLQQEKSTLIAKQQKKKVLYISLLLILVSLVCMLLYRTNKGKNRFSEALENQVHLKTIELQRSNAQLKESNIELERFAHIASHDLKEPLRNISSFSQLLERKLKKYETEGVVLEYTSFIKKNAKQMNTLIQDVLEYSNGNIENLRIEKMDTQKVLSEIQDSLAFEINLKNASIIVSPDIPEVNAIKTQLTLIFRNLISNGIKFNHSKTPQVNITYKRLEGFHQFCVTDNGIGIDARYHNSVFEMFYRLHNRSEYEGSGLGLATCKKMVTKIGGKIWTEKMDQGSCFCFTIPVVYTSLPKSTLN